MDCVAVKVVLQMTYNLLPNKFWGKGKDVVPTMCLGKPING